MIDREQAAEIARLAALAAGLGQRVSSVEAASRIAGRRPMLYGLDVADHWIAYIEHPGPPALRASTIVVIDRETGAVLYSGSAHDEG